MITTTGDISFISPNKIESNNSTFIELLNFFLIWWNGSWTTVDNERFVIDGSDEEKSVNEMLLLRALLIAVGKSHSFRATFQFNDRGTRTTPTTPPTPLLLSADVVQSRAPTGLQLAERGEQETFPRFGISCPNHAFIERIRSNLCRNSVAMVTQS